MRSQLTWTLITELVVMAAGIFVLKLAAQFLGAVGFGEYTLTRRATALLYLPLVLGFGIAAPRYIAIATAGALPGYSPRLFAVATLTAGLLPALIVIVLMNLSPGGASAILFGSAKMSFLVPAATIALAGLTMHSMTYAVFRGRGDMNLANLLQLVNNGIVPVTAFMFVPHYAPTVLTATGMTWMLTSVAALVGVMTRDRTKEIAEHPFGDHLRILLRFGVPRVPGEFALVGLFALPALMALRTQGVVAAGQFSAGMSLLSLVAGVFGPVGLVMLPRASAQAASGDLHGLRRIVLKMLAGGIVLAIAAVAIGEFLIPPFVRWYFGKDFIAAIPVFRICLLGAIPYVIYVLLRNILDALDVRAVNSRNLLITLGLLLILSALRTDIRSMASSLVIALTVLGGLSLWETQARLGRRALASRVSDTPTIPLTVPAP
jgi:O-antigen/teichoic acid export membrane protein